jgi:hypothetical protein
MAHDEVRREAAVDGFELDERVCERLGVGLVPGRRRRWPCYLEERRRSTGCETDYGAGRCSLRLRLGNSRCLNAKN